LSITVQGWIIAVQGMMGIGFDIFVPQLPRMGWAGRAVADLPTSGAWSESHGSSLPW
jgi:hypothetical protein